MLIVRVKNHPSTRHLPDIWEPTDEWYNFRTLLDPEINSIDHAGRIILYRRK